MNSVKFKLKLSSPQTPHLYPIPNQSYLLPTPPFQWLPLKRFLLGELEKVFPA